MIKGTASAQLNDKLLQFPSVSENTDEKHWRNTFPQMIRGFVPFIKLGNVIMLNLSRIFRNQLFEGRKSIKIPPDGRFAPSWWLQRDAVFSRSKPQQNLLFPFDVPCTLSRSKLSKMDHTKWVRQTAIFRNWRWHPFSTYLYTPILSLFLRKLYNFPFLYFYALFVDYLEFWPWRFSHQWMEWEKSFERALFKRNYSDLWKQPQVEHNFALEQIELQLLKKD